MAAIKNIKILRRIERLLNQKGGAVCGNIARLAAGVSSFEPDDSEGLRTARQFWISQDLKEELKEMSDEMVLFGLQKHKMENSSRKDASGRFEACLRQIRKIKQQ